MTYSFTNRMPCLNRLPVKKVVYHKLCKSRLASQRESEFDTIWDTTFKNKQRFAGQVHPQRNGTSPLRISILDHVLRFIWHCLPGHLDLENVKIDLSDMK